MIWTFISNHAVLIVTTAALIALIIIIVLICVKPLINAERLKSVSDLFAIVLLFLCGVSVLVAGVSWFRPARQITNEHKIILSACPDSSDFDSEVFNFYSDSLINVINLHERLLEEKYLSFLSEKEQTFRIESVVGILISIIVSIVGFFGYKSIKSIEKKASDLAKDQVKKDVKDYLNTNLADSIRGELKASFIDYIDEKTAHKLASQVKGEIRDQIVEDIKTQIREDIVGYFTVGEKKDTHNSEPGAGNPFDKS